MKDEEYELMEDEEPEEYSEAAAEEPIPPSYLSDHDLADWDMSL